MHHKKLFLLDIAIFVLLSFTTINSVEASSEFGAEPNLWRRRVGN